jgi:hypothetical protein
MPKEEKERGILNADDFVRFIYGMTEHIQPREKAGFSDDMINAGFPFREVRPDGSLTYEYEPNSSLVNILKTADCSTLAAFALIPVRAGEVAILTSKSLYRKFQKELRDGTEAAKKIPFVYNKYASPKKEREIPTVTESDLRRLYGDRVVVNVAGSRNKISFPTIYSSDFRLDGSYQGDVSVNFPGGTGRGEARGSHSENIEDLEWEEGAQASYSMTLTGPIKRGQIKRSHNCVG